MISIDGRLSKGPTEITNTLKAIDVGYVSYEGNGGVHQNIVLAAKIFLLLCFYL